MTAAELEKIMSTFHEALDSRFCRECGRRLLPSSRQAKNGTIEVLYKCSNRTCTGAYVHATPLF